MKLSSEIHKSFKMFQAIHIPFVANKINLKRKFIIRYYFFNKHYIKPTKDIFREINYKNNIKIQ